MVVSKHHIPEPWTLHLCGASDRIGVAARKHPSAHSNARLTACSWCRAQGSSK